MAQSAEERSKKTVMERYCDVRIEICGGIASGKTTLAEALGSLRIAIIFEDFKLNPFWSLFYKHPQEHAFETEVTFLLQHYSQIKVHQVNQSVLVCDFSLLLDQAYADVNLHADRLAAFRAVYDLVRRELSQPALLVHLRCGATEELARIRSRARAEENSVTINYLEALNGAIERRVKEVEDATRVLTIDSEANDFAYDPDTRARIARMIWDALPAYGSTA